MREVRADVRHTRHVNEEFGELKKPGSYVADRRGQTEIAADLGTCP
jgi:hypothetical protein